MKSSKRRGSNGNNSGKNNYNQNQRKGSNGENSTSLAEPSNKSKKNSRSPKPLKKIPPTKPERVSSRSSSLQRIFILPRSGRSSPVTIASQKNDPRILPGDTEDQKTVDVQKFVSVPLPRTIFL